MKQHVGCVWPDFCTRWQYICASWSAYLAVKAADWVNRNWCDVPPCAAVWCHWWHCQVEVGGTTMAAGSLAAATDVLLEHKNTKNQHKNGKNQNQKSVKKHAARRPDLARVAVLAAWPQMHDLLLLWRCRGKCCLPKFEWNVAAAAMLWLSFCCPIMVHPRPVVDWSPCHWLVVCGWVRWVLLSYCIVSHLASRQPSACARAHECMLHIYMYTIHVHPGSRLMRF